MSTTVQVGVGPLGYVLVPAEPETVESESGADMTPQECKANFRARGESPGQWADKHGFERALIYRLLNGRAAGWRGKTHQAAVALGLKPDPAKSTV